MRYSAFCKALALILCAVSLVVLVVSGFGVIALMEFDLYSQTPEEYFQESYASQTKAFAQELVNRYAAEKEGKWPKQSLEVLDNLYGYDPLTEDLVSYQILDVNGTLLYEKKAAAPVENTLTYTHDVIAMYPLLLEYRVNGAIQYQLRDEVQYRNIYTYRHYDTRTDQHQEYQIAEHVAGSYYEISMELLPEGNWNTADVAYRLMRVLWLLRYWILGILGAALAVLVTTGIYLGCSAGRQSKGSPAAPAGMNRLPLDLYGCGVFALVGCALVGLSRACKFFLYSDYTAVLMAVIAALSLVMAFSIVGFLFAFAAQSKRGIRYLLGHTLVARVLLWLWKQARKLVTWAYGWLRRGFALLPFMWQWLLGMLLIGILPLWSLLVIHSGVLFLLSMVLYLAVGLYACYAFGQLMQKAKDMSRGDLAPKTENPRLVGCFREFAGELNTLSEVVSRAAAERMRSERMKAELVTNVSHDLKTPLTSIINYVDLLQKTQDPAKQQEYLAVLERQSQHMKKLITDLVEMSKASTGNLPVELASVDAVETLNQALGEFADKLAAAQLLPVLKAPGTAVPVLGDGKLMWRVLSNVLGNTVKYALPGTRVYLEVAEEGETVTVCVKNISREPLNISAQELMERFVRGDASRNTEGSGLGLNIAQSLMELQHGTLQLEIDGDLFKVVLTFRHV